MVCAVAYSAPKIAACRARSYGLDYPKGSLFQRLCFSGSVLRAHRITLPKVTVPTLVFHCINDKAVARASLGEIR
jgi:hypothetical protein